MTVLALVITLFSSPTSTYAISYSDLAAYWAPQIYQDVNADLGVRADFITNFNYDGDYLALNNCDNLNNYNENGYVYYKVSETTTHYFIETICSMQGTMPTPRLSMPMKMTLKAVS